MKHAPIALFVYERLWHTQQTVQSLQKAILANQSNLYIFSDAAKTPKNAPNVAKVRAWLSQIDGFKGVQIIEREKNLGLANSIIAGVTELVNRFGKVIVVEDDLIVSTQFLKYMNEGLELYQHDSQVASIHGYAFPFKERMPETYFMKGTDCWGWATWKRAWDKFEPDGRKLLNSLSQQNLLKEFDYNGTHRYSNMLKDQILGKNNSWAIRWHASAFIHNMFTLFPGESLVHNIGMDSSGEHCISSSALDVEVSQAPVNLKKIPIEKNAQIFAIFMHYFKSLKEPLLKKIWRKIKAIIG